MGGWSSSIWWMRLYKNPSVASIEGPFPKAFPLALRSWIQRGPTPSWRVQIRSSWLGLAQPGDVRGVITETLRARWHRQNVVWIMCSKKVAENPSHIRFPHQIPYGHLLQSWNDPEGPSTWQAPKRNLKSPKSALGLSSHWIVLPTWTVQSWKPLGRCVIAEQRWRPSTKTCGSWLLLRLGILGSYQITSFWKLEG